MTRISLKEQYDNSSIIKQIVDLSDEVDSVVETAESAKTMVTEAATKADAAKAAADTATTKNTEQDAQIASIQAKDTEQDTAIAGVKATADAALADVTINTDEISATLLLKNSVDSETSKAIPLASENATGMMTKATYSGMVALGDRVTALEGKTTVVYVSFTSDEPSQSEITNLFTAQTGKAPIAGNQAVDIARSLTYQYNGSEWLKTTQQIANWSNTTSGLVKGTPAGTENAGTIFAENDGTGSVNGWDDLVARVATSESAISTTIPNTYATKTALGEVESTANNAQAKVNEAIYNVSVDGSTMIFTRFDDQHIDLPIPSVSILDKTAPIVLSSAPTKQTGSNNTNLYKCNYMDGTKLLSVGDNVIACNEAVYLNSSSVTSYITLTAAQVTELVNKTVEGVVFNDGWFKFVWLIGGKATQGVAQMESVIVTTAISTPIITAVHIVDNEVTEVKWANPDVKYWSQTSFYDSFILISITEIEMPS